MTIRTITAQNLVFRESARSLLPFKERGRGCRPVHPWGGGPRRADHSRPPALRTDGFGLRPSDEVDSPAGFAAFVARLTDASDPAKPLGAGRVHCKYRWIVEGDQVLGGIAFRHELNDFVLRVGHIGYGIRPSARRRGSPPGRWAECSTRRGYSAWTGC